MHTARHAQSDGRVGDVDDASRALHKLVKHRGRHDALERRTGADSRAVNDRQRGRGVRETADIIAPVAERDVEARRPRARPREDALVVAVHDDHEGHHAVCDHALAGSDGECLLAEAMLQCPGLEHGVDGVLVGPPGH